MIIERKQTPVELAEGMQQYLENLKKNPNREESRRSLIRTGVLDQNGCRKKQICTGGYYVGKQ